jgi:hypothetical protein
VYTLNGKGLLSQSSVWPLARTECGVCAVASWKDRATDRSAFTVFTSPERTWRQPGSPRLQMNRYGALNTPRSVMIAVISAAGVTSKAGL